MTHTNDQSDETTPKTPTILNLATACTSPTTQLITFNPSSQLPIKLAGRSNFPTWKVQVFTLMCGYDLLSYLDRSVTPPSQTPKQLDYDIINLE